MEWLPPCIRCGRTRSILRDEQTSPEQYISFRRMTPAKRSALAEGLYGSAREWKTAWLRGRHADGSEDRIEREVTRLFLHGRT